MSITEDKFPMEKVRKLIDQPIDGLLYDLNMLPEVLASLDKKDTKQWLVMKVIKALKEQIDNPDGVLKQGVDCLIWKIKNENNNGHRFIITSTEKGTTEFVENKLGDTEYIDVCHTLSGHLEASIEIFL